MTAVRCQTQGVLESGTSWIDSGPTAAPITRVGCLAAPLGTAATVREEADVPIGPAGMKLGETPGMLPGAAPDTGTGGTPCGPGTRPATGGAAATTGTFAFTGVPGAGALLGAFGAFGALATTGALPPATAEAQSTSDSELCCLHQPLV